MCFYFTIVHIQLYLHRRFPIKLYITKHLCICHFRSDAPWAKASLLMGLHEDLKFKVSVPEEYKETISEEIKSTLHAQRSAKAVEYLTKLEVIGMKQPFWFERDAAVTLLPGQRLHLSNGKGVRLTAFLVAGTKVYALSTTHTDDLTGDWVKHVHYDTGTNQYNAALNRIALGEIVSHVCEGSPFREACLIEVYPEQLKCVSELLSEIPPRFILNFYNGETKNILAIKKRCYMSSGPENFKELSCHAICDMKCNEQILKDAVLWKSDTNAGGPGESGSGIFGLSQGGDLDLVAMYIGRGMGHYDGLLISHGMKATLEYFSERIGQRLEVCNPDTKPLAAINATHTLHPNQASNANYTNEGAGLSSQEMFGSHALDAENGVDEPQGSSTVTVIQYSPEVDVPQAGSASELEDSSNATEPTQGTNVDDTSETGSGVNTEEEEGDENFQEVPNVDQTCVKMPETYFMSSSLRPILHRSAKCGEQPQKRKAGMENVEVQETKRKRETPNGLWDAMEILIDGMDSSEEEA